MQVFKGAEVLAKIGFTDIDAAVIQARAARIVFNDGSQCVFFNEAEKGSAGDPVGPVGVAVSFGCKGDSLAALFAKRFSRHKWSMSTDEKAYLRSVERFLSDDPFSDSE